MIDGCIRLLQQLNLGSIKLKIYYLVEKETISKLHSILWPTQTLKVLFWTQVETRLVGQLEWRGKYYI